MSTTSTQSTPSRRSLWRRVRIDYLGVFASVIAISISIWSTRIAQNAYDQQSEAMRSAQASQVLLFNERSHRTEGNQFGPDRYSNTFIRNYSRLPVPNVDLLVEVGDDPRILNFAEEDTEKFLYTLGALGPCRQFSVGSLIADVPARWEEETGRSSQEEAVKLFPAILFQDVMGRPWFRAFGGPADFYESVGGEVIHDTIRPSVLAEPIPECTPG